MCVVGIRIGASHLAFGERPAELNRLALILHLSVEETIALVRENTTARIEDGLVHWDDPYPGHQLRRTVYVGDRAVPMNSGCAPDLFAFAAVFDVPFRVEDTCATTGVPIRVDFVPGGFERVDPPETVTVLFPVGEQRDAIGENFEQVNANVCTYQPFFASTEAAGPMLIARPGSRVFIKADPTRAARITRWPAARTAKLAVAAAGTPASPTSGPDARRCRKPTGTSTCRAARVPGPWVGREPAARVGSAATVRGRLQCRKPCTTPGPGAAPRRSRRTGAARRPGPPSPCPPRSAATPPIAPPPCSHGATVPSMAPAVTAATHRGRGTHAVPPLGAGCGHLEGV